RELDVKARRSFSRLPTTDPAYATAFLEVPIEVKSLRGYHVVFAPNPHRSHRSPSAQRAWWGYNADKLGSVLLGSDVPADVATALVARFRELSYPNDGSMVVGDLIVDPPMIQSAATAFRETNIGNEKELDASVVWKSIQGLKSAIESMRQRGDDLFESEI